MPLPDSSPPEDSRLYKLFKGKKLEDFTADNIDSLRDSIFFESESEDLLRRLVLFGAVSGQQSFSGPIARTQQIVQATYTSTGTETFFQPGVGEVWMLVGGDTLGSGGTGSIQWQLKDAAGTVALIFQTSVSGQEPIGQNSTNNNLLSPIYITSDNYLVANCSAVATSVRATISFIRVR
jgi:hypothetical protein